MDGGETTTIRDRWFYLRADGLVYKPTNLHAVKSKQTWRTDVESWRGELTWRQRYGIIDEFGKVPVRLSEEPDNDEDEFELIMKIRSNR